MDVRPVRLDDNDQLVKLSLSAPMIGEVEVAIDRSPDYFAYYNQFGDCMNHVPSDQIDPEKDFGWVAACVEEQGGRIVGVIGMVTKPVNYEGKIIRAAIPCDARIAPEYQSKGVAKRIISFYGKTWAANPADVMIGYIIKGNHRAEKGFKEGSREVVTGIPAGEFNMIQTSMYRPYRNAALKLERAGAGDIGEIVELLAEYYHDYHFSPVFTRQRFSEMLSRTPGYGIEDIRIVRENGRIQALIGLWDMVKVRRVVAQSFPMKIRLGIYIAWMLRVFFKAPTPPQIGQPQQSAFIKHIAHRPGKLDLLASMMKNLNNELRIAQRHNYIWGAFFQTDPLYSIFDSMQITKVRSGQYISPWNSGWFQTPEQVQSKPCYADFSTV